MPRSFDRLRFSGVPPSATQHLVGNVAGPKYDPLFSFTLLSSGARRRFLTLPGALCAQTLWTPRDTPCWEWQPRTNRLRQRRSAHSKSALMLRNQRLSIALAVLALHGICLYCVSRPTTAIMLPETPTPEDGCDSPAESAGTEGMP